MKKPGKYYNQLKEEIKDHKCTWRKDMFKYICNKHKAGFFLRQGRINNQLPLEQNLFACLQIKDYFALLLAVIYKLVKISTPWRLNNVLNEAYFSMVIPYTLFAYSTLPYSNRAISQFVTEPINLYIVRILDPSCTISCAVRKCQFFANLLPW